MTISFGAYAKDRHTHPTDLLHRIRNLGEDIFRALRGRRIAELQNMDTAVDTLELIIPSEGKVRKVELLIRPLLKQHNFADAEITVQPLG